MASSSDITRCLTVFIQRRINKTNAEAVLAAADVLMKGNTDAVMADIVYASRVLAHVAALPRIDVQVCYH